MKSVDPLHGIAAFLAVASPQAVFVVPTPIVDMVTESGVPAARPLPENPGPLRWAAP